MAAIMGIFRHGVVCALLFQHVLRNPFGLPSRGVDVGRQSTEGAEPEVEVKMSSTNEDTFNLNGTTYQLVQPNCTVIDCEWEGGDWGSATNSSESSLQKSAEEQPPWTPISVTREGESLEARLQRERAEPNPAFRTREEPAPCV